MKKQVPALLMALGLIATACGSTADTVTDAAAQVVEEAAVAEEAMEDEAMEDDEEAMEDEAVEDEDAMEDVSHDLNLENNAELGQILTDAGGYTVYLFTNDEQGAGTSACEGDCIAAWPVVGEILSLIHI